MRRRRPPSRRRSLRPARRLRTTWHPLFIRALRFALPRLYFRVLSEVQLNQEPLRLDALVLRRKLPPPGMRPKALQVLFDLLGERTLISLKGANDRADWTDLLHLLNSALLYCAQEALCDPGPVRLMLVTPRVTAALVEQVRHRGGTLRALRPGVDEVRILGHLLYVVRTEEVEDRVLRIFSRSFLLGGLAGAAAAEELLSEEERSIFIELVNEVEQIQERPAARLRYPDLKEVKMSLDEFYDAILAKVPARKRLKGLGAEERLEGLAAKDRLKGLGAEERLEGLSPEERERVLQLLLSQKKGS